MFYEFKLITRKKNFYKNVRVSNSKCDVVCFCFWDTRVYFWLDNYWELEFDYLISYDVYMNDNIEVTRLNFSCEEAVILEGLVFLLRGLCGNLVIIWKYYLFMDFL